MTQLSIYIFFFIKILLSNLKCKLNYMKSLIVISSQILIHGFLVYKNKKCDILFITKYISITIALIFILHFLRIYYFKDKDVFNKSFSILDIDIWSLTHFIYYFILMYRCKESDIKHLSYKLITLGIIFELVEEYVGPYVDNLIYLKLLKKKKSSLFWYGKISDIFVNTLGMVLGTLFFKSIN